MKKVLIAVVMLGMSGGAYAADFSDLAVKAGGLNTLAAEGVSVPDVSKGYAEPGPMLMEWIPIYGGKFMMGSNTIEEGFENAKPMHEVAVKAFEMSQTAVTVAQYAECVNKGQCAIPGTIGSLCNWGKPGRENHPLNCVSWDQANQYAKFQRARLPSEAEWEYAATSRGKSQKYPWGNDAPTCDKAVMSGKGGNGCGTGGTMPVCSKPAGNTEQGLCDMAGNVYQWVQDKYQGSYKGVPADGTAFEPESSFSPDFFTPGYSYQFRVMRGGSFNSDLAIYFRSDYRNGRLPGDQLNHVGFRIVRPR